MKNVETESKDTEHKPASKPGVLERVWTWFDQRTGVDRVLRRTLDEPIPGGARLAYVFGSGLLFIFLSQVVTGVCLALYYVPAPTIAHTSVAYIVKEVAAGSFLRSLHSYGSSAMIVVLVLHFLQTFLYGSFKGKRQILWMSGCVLALLVVGMAFTGYILPWDQSGYSAGSVGTNIVGQIPLIGDGMRRLLRGGSSMGALTLSRFYVLHILIIPALIFSFVAAHIILFRKAGAAGPVRTDPVTPGAVTEPFYPKQVLIDMSFVLLVMGTLGMLAHFVPVTLGREADPSNTTYVPRPEWYFLPMFQWLKSWEGWSTVIGVIVIPVILGGLLFFLPFLDRGSERRPWRRPIPVVGVLLVVLGAIWLGMSSRLDDARDPGVAAQLAQQSRQEEVYFHAPFKPYSAASGGVSSAPSDVTVGEGKGLFDSHGCSGCHGESGGGAKGPALTSISTKYQAAQLTTLLKTPSAGMKAGGMVPLDFDDAQFSALYSYLSSLGGAGVTSLTSAALSKPRATAPVESTTSASGSASASAASGSPTTIGEGVFKTHDCAGCHGVGGIGTSRAPALTKLSGTMSAAALKTVLEHPTHAMQSGGMPAVKLSSQEMNDLVEYLRALSAPATSTHATHASAPAAPTGSSSATSPTGSSSASASASTSATTVGEGVFKTQACAGCHGVGGIGTSRAPALTKLAGTMSVAALEKVLEHPTHAMQSGGMPAIKLTSQNMNDLVEYLRTLSAPATSTHATHASAPAAPTGSSSATSPTGSSSASASASTSATTVGEGVFKTQACAGCHGVGGIGTSRAPALTKLAGTMSVAALEKVLEHPTHAMQSGGMPAIKLTSQNMNDLVDYLRSLASAPTTNAPQPHAGSPTSTGDAAAGRAVYTHCALCHGATGKGDGAIGSVLGLKPTNFTTALPNDDAWLKAIELGSTAAGKSEGMRGFKNDLTDTQIRDVLAYIKTLK